MSSTAAVRRLTARARGLRQQIRASSRVRRTEAALAVPPASSFAAMGEGSFFVPPARISHPGSVHVGDGVTVLEHSWLHSRSGAALVLDDATSLLRFVKIVAWEHVHIGRGVVLSDRCYVTDVEFLPGSDCLIDDRPLTDPAPVVIEDGVFLGAGVVVKPGVTIGRHAYVGASSVVAEDVAPRTLVVGNPARVVRTFDVTENS